MQIAAEGMRHTLLSLMKLGLSVQRFGGALHFLCCRVCASNALAWLVAAQTDAGFFTVGGRVFTLATTPPALDSFFDDFCKKIRSENEQGKYFFQLTNHSLVCEKCIEKDPQQCSHKLYLVPPWKSIARFENLRRMVPGKQREEFSAEVFGVLKRSSTNYFPAKIVHATLNWTNSKHVREINFVGLSSADTSTFVIFVAIDPASHQKSSMGLSAISYTDTGQIVLLGISEVPMQSSDLLQCQMICERFIFRLFASLTSGMVVDLSRTTIVPVVEVSTARCLFCLL